MENVSRLVVEFPLAMSCKEFWEGDDEGRALVVLQGQVRGGAYEGFVGGAL